MGSAFMNPCIFNPIGIEGFSISLFQTATLLNFMQYYGFISIMDQKSTYHFRLFIALFHCLSV